MSNSKSTLKSTPTFQQNDRVEAHWLEDSKWYPATVLKVVRNNLFRIRFDDVEKKANCDYGSHDLRKKGAAPPADSAKEAAAAPVCAPAQAEAAVEAAPAPASAPPPVASANEGGSKCTVDSTLKSTPAFQVNDRVEAFWRDDGEWHPAEVLEVVPNRGFRIRFDGYAEKYVFKVQDLRVARIDEFKAQVERLTHQFSAEVLARSTRSLSQAAAVNSELNDQIERLTSELSSSQAEAASSRRDAENARRDLRAAEQQASDDRAQMQREQSQAAAAIGELKAQVERLTSELSSIARRVSDLHASKRVRASAVAYILSGSSAQTRPARSASVDFDEEGRRLQKPAAGASRCNALDPIITHSSGNCIYVGNQDAAMSIDMLKAHGIKSVVNCTENMPFYLEKGDAVQYYRFDISRWSRHTGDGSVPAVKRFVDPMFKFVDDALARGSVLVHCLAGAHRAGSTGVLLLMRHNHLDVPSAIETAKSLRPIIDPHFSSRLPRFLDLCKQTYGMEWAEAARSANK